MDFSVTNQDDDYEVISSFSMQSIGKFLTVFATAAGATSTAWGTAGLAIYVPFVIYQPFTIMKMTCCNGATAGAGTLDMGVYDVAFHRLVSQGSGTNQVGTSALQAAFDLTDTTILPGQYYMGLAHNTTTGTFLSAPMGNAAATRGSGVLEQTGTSGVLPNPMVPVAYTRTFVPLFGVWGRTNV